MGGDLITGLMRYSSVDTGADHTVGEHMLLCSTIMRVWVCALDWMCAQMLIISWTVFTNTLCKFIMLCINYKVSLEASSSLDGSKVDHFRTFFLCSKWLSRNEISFHQPKLLSSIYGKRIIFFRENIQHLKLLIAINRFCLCNRMNLVEG